MSGPTGRTVAAFALAFVAAAGLSAAHLPGSDPARPAATAPSAGPSTSMVAESGQRTPTRGPIGPEPTNRRKVPLNLLGGLIEGSPIFPGDFADPFLLAERTALYIFATNTTAANVPVTRIRVGDVFNGDYLGDALPRLPSWTVKGFQWAPSVWARPDGSFVMYYSTPAPSQGFAVPRKQCISRAVASAPAGPYVDDSAAPLICPLEAGGAIDPSPFVDRGRLFLLWKVDGNSDGLPTMIMSQPMSADGLTTAGPPTELISADQTWEAGIVEGPSMVRVGGRYELFYSANNWNSAAYSVGIALCDSVTGPCAKPMDRAWMVSRQRYTGPGGQEFFDNPGGVWMVHHGFLPGQAGTPGGQRRLYLDLLRYSGTDPIPTLGGAERAEVALGRILLVGAGIAVILVGAVALLRSRRRRTTRPQPREVPIP